MEHSKTKIIHSLYLLLGVHFIFFTGGFLKIKTLAVNLTICFQLYQFSLIRRGPICLKGQIRQKVETLKEKVTILRVQNIFASTKIA